MEKHVNATAAGRQFDRILNEVFAQGEAYIVERGDEVVAAVVPIAVYEQWKAARSLFFARVKAAAERGDITLEEADALGDEAVRVLRAENDEAER